jgi:hypothetical protein
MSNGDQILRGYAILTGRVTYRKGLWCKRGVLMHKLDSVLTYFTGLQSGQKSKIGVHAP